MLTRARPVDSARVIGLVNRACVDGVGHACAAQAGMYALGEVVPKDYTRVSLLERRACDLGVADACMVEAQAALAAGDYDQSFSFFEKACHIGNPEACGLYAGHLRLGKGVAVDAEGSFQWMAVSCVTGHPPSCVDLIQNQRDLPLQEPARTEFLTAACAGGVPEACALQVVPPTP